MAKQKFNITEFDIIFLSYDEPNAEKHWADLLDKCPWAKRVHGVAGFDAAHRACAEKSETDWFVTVDADNIVLPSFFDVTVELDPVLDSNRCFSWNGVNMINGLMYGNGGLKLWSKKFASNMRSHELSDTADAVDFCWESDYTQVYATYSEVWNNCSPYQAFRVGFREGVKLALDRGQRVPPEKMKSVLHDANLRNLRIWTSVGSDVDNGIWAIAGARAGLLAMCDMTWDFSVVRDYAWFFEYWKDGFEKRYNVEKTATGYSWDRTKLSGDISWMSVELKEKTKMSFPFLDADTSEFFRETFKLRNV